MRKIKPYDKCQICGSVDMYFAYDENTLHLNQVCEHCHTIHYLATIPMKETVEIEKGKENL